jgi:hypothetical protein
MRAVARRPGARRGRARRARRGAAARARAAPRAAPRRALAVARVVAGAAAGQRARLDRAAVGGGAGARAQAAGCARARDCGRGRGGGDAPQTAAAPPCARQRPVPRQPQPKHPPPSAGEDPPPGADRGALLQRLAARRLAERARVVRLPLRLTFAGRRSSRRYLTVPIDCGDIGFVDFLLEAGSYNCLISPELRDRLGLGPADGTAVRALDSRGPTVRQRVELPPMWLGARAGGRRGGPKGQQGARRGGGRRAGLLAWHAPLALHAPPTARPRPPPPDNPQARSRCRQ